MQGCNGSHRAIILNRRNLFYWSLDFFLRVRSRHDTSMSKRFPFPKCCLCLFRRRLNARPPPATTAVHAVKVEALLAAPAQLVTKGMCANMVGNIIY